MNVQLLIAKLNTLILPRLKHEDCHNKHSDSWLAGLESRSGCSNFHLMIIGQYLRAVTWLKPKTRGYVQMFIQCHEVYEKYESWNKCLETSLECIYRWNNWNNLFSNIAGAKLTKAVENVFFDFFNQQNHPWLIVGAGDFVHDFKSKQLASKRFWCVPGYGNARRIQHPNDNISKWSNYKIQNTYLDIRVLSSDQGNPIKESFSFGKVFHCYLKYKSNRKCIFTNLLSDSIFLMCDQFLNNFYIHNLDSTSAQAHLTIITDVSSVCQPRARYFPKVTKDFITPILLVPLLVLPTSN